MNQITPAASLADEAKLRNQDCFPIDHVRAQFPALSDGFIFFDNAAGAQAPQRVLDSVQRHLLECNVQRGGRYAKSREVDATITRARESVAVLVNAFDP